MSVKREKEHHRTNYFLVAPDETRELNLFKQLSDSNSIIGRLCDVLNLNEPDLDEAKYVLQFLAVPCVLAKLERQRVLRKHKSNDQQNKVLKNQRNNYKSMNPVKKQALFKKQELKYKEINPIKKQALLEGLEVKYKQMHPTKKQVLLENLQVKYKEMEPLKKIFLEKQAKVYKAMDSSEKEGYRERNRGNMKRKYHATNSPKKNEKKMNSIRNLNRVQTILI